MYTSNDNYRYPSRKNPRNQAIDYSAPNYYFITICTDQKACIFGEPNQLNEFGKIALDGIEQISVHYPEVTVDKCVVMPNHIHAILILTGNGRSVSDIVCSYKAYVTKRIHEIQPIRKVWQSSFHDHVIRNQQSYEKIWLYIEGNPLNWNKDCFYSDMQRRN